MRFDELDELFGPVERRVDDDGALTIEAPARSDIFVSPAGLPPTLNGAALLTSTDGDFTLAATVHAGLRATFDAGALLLWRDAATWAKLALERSPAGDATVVSVVTRGVSDDCNSLVLPEPTARIRVARTGEACAFHLWSGGRWDLVRHFSLGPGPLATGFLCQSPTGGGTQATFSEVELAAETIEDVRSGD
jgi:regulation of enolase protein 1 (concanavalin A-like superfamily)